MKNEGGKYVLYPGFFSCEEGRKWIVARSFGEEAVTRIVLSEGEEQIIVSGSSQPGTEIVSEVKGEINDFIYDVTIFGIRSEAGNTDDADKGMISVLRTTSKEELLCFLEQDQKDYSMVEASLFVSEWTDNGGGVTEEITRNIVIHTPLSLTVSFTGASEYEEPISLGSGVRLVVDSDSIVHANSFYSNQCAVCTRVIVYSPNSEVNYDQGWSSTFEDCGIITAKSVNGERGNGTRNCGVIEEQAGCIHVTKQNVDVLGGNGTVISLENTGIESLIIEGDEAPSTLCIQTPVSLVLGEATTMTKIFLSRSASGSEIDAIERWLAYGRITYAEGTSIRWTGAEPKNNPEEYQEYLIENLSNTFWTAMEEFILDKIAEESEGNVTKEFPSSYIQLNTYCTRNVNSEIYSYSWEEDTFIISYTGGDSNDNEEKYELRYSSYPQVYCSHEVYDRMEFPEYQPKQWTKREMNGYTVYFGCSCNVKKNGSGETSISNFFAAYVFKKDVLVGIVFFGPHDTYEPEWRFLLTVIDYETGIVTEASKYYSVSQYTENGVEYFWEGWYLVYDDCGFAWETGDHCCGGAKYEYEYVDEVPDNIRAILEEKGYCGNYMTVEWYKELMNAHGTIPIPDFGE